MCIKREFKLRSSCKLMNELEEDLLAFNVNIIHSATEAITVPYPGLEDKEWFMRFYECSIDNELFDNFVEFLKTKYARLNITLMY